MERHQLIEAMTSLKLYDMRASFDEIAGKGLTPRRDLSPAGEPDPRGADPSPAAFNQLSH
ncbi:hypothetical protein BOSEA31B_13410 [Hyphomicrobiales bacterium]|nr:hypothetical protein BOSEA31B_13410 [Hyphomicrobiales bacterium]CAH1699180.1 hypothetical protein BOSEA1005_12233 [Hyphomicrobiales bacterium]CAI0342966.1 hypothetical protein BO1005MUT1_210031 [Hyphomicrobiales bacterium]